MQETIRIECSSCGHWLCLEQDPGMSRGTLAEAIPLTRGKLRQRLQRYEREGAAGLAEYRSRLMACPSCDTLHGRFYVRVEFDDLRVYETVFRCGKCRSLLIEPGKAIAEHRCGACSQRSLSETSSES